MLLLKYIEMTVILSATYHFLGKCLRSSKSEKIHKRTRFEVMKSCLCINEGRMKQIKDSFSSQTIITAHQNIVQRLCAASQGFSLSVIIKLRLTHRKWSNSHCIGNLTKLSPTRFCLSLRLMYFAFCIS